MGANLSPMHKFTVDEYYRMLNVGIFHEDDRIELIDGIVVEMSPTGPKHAACVSRLTEILVIALQQGRGILRVQDPISLPTASEPQPDIVVARPPRSRYNEHHPRAEDTLLVIEVADTSLMYDRQTKVPLYGAAGIPEVWVVDLTRNLVEVHTAPNLQGYANVSVVRSDGAVCPGAFPDIRIKVSEILS